MDFFNKALAQFNELFRSMTIGARITAGLLLAVVAISLVWLFRYETSSPDTYLMNGMPLSANDITNLEAAFGEAKLDSYVVEGNRIRVPRGEKALYMAAAADHKALPNGFLRYLDDAVNSQGIFPEDRHEREERLKVAKQKELSDIIGSMAGIESAKVFWDSETKGGLNPQTIKTALVYVKPRGSATLDSEQVASIRGVVLGAVAGLKDADVRVTDQNTGRTYSGDPNGDGAMDNAYYSAKWQAEQRFKAKILSALADIHGVIVGVNVDPEKELGSRKIEQKPDQKGTVVRRQEKSTTKTRDGSVPAGRAGFEANRPQAIAPSTGKGSHEEQEDSQSTEENLVGSSSTETEKPGLTPARVTATIIVPTSYFEEVWRRQNPVPAGEQPKMPSQTDLDQLRTKVIASIKASVAPLLPPPDNTTGAPTDPTQLVTVTELPDIAPAPIPAIGLPERILDWVVRNWTTLGLIFLGGFSLVVLRSIARSAPAAAPRPASPPISLDLSAPQQPAAEPQEAAPVTATAERRLRRPASVARSLREELSELVAEDPDAAAGVLRTWIGNVR